MRRTRKHDIGVGRTLGVFFYRVIQFRLYMGLQGGTDVDLLSADLVTNVFSFAILTLYRPKNGAVSLSGAGNGTCRRLRRVAALPEGDA
jgi:hypothetical protein